VWVRPFPHGRDEPCVAFWGLRGRRRYYCGPVHNWIRHSLGFKLVLFALVAGALTDYASAHAALGGWHGRSGADDLSIVFIVPLAIVFGVICGIFFVKHSPQSFLEPHELSDDPEERRRFKDLRAVDFIGYVAYSAFAVIPIMFIAWAISELGFSSG